MGNVKYNINPIIINSLILLFLFMKIKTTILLLTSFWISLANAQKLDFGIRIGTDLPYDFVDYGKVLSFDKDGNIIITGRGTPSIVFGAGEANETTLDIGTIYLAKYNTSGKLIWAKQAGQYNQGMESTDLVVDENGNIFLTGNYFISTVFGEGNSRDTLNTEEGAIFLAKYLSDGTFSWAKSFGYKGDNRGEKITIDKANNIYLGGSYRDSIFFDNQESGIKLYPNGTNDAFLAKFNAEGSVIWAKSFGSATADDGGFTRLVFNGDSSLYFGLYFFDNITFEKGTNKETTLVQANVAGLIASYDLNGNFIFAKETLINDYGDGIHDIRLDSEGNLLAIGIYAGNATFKTQTGTFQQGGTYPSLFVAKYSKDGYAIWACRFSPSSYNISGGRISLDDSNNIFISAYFEGQMTLGGGTRNETTIGSDGKMSSFMAKLSPDGEFIWANQLLSSEGSTINDLLCDSVGNAYITGYYMDSLFLQTSGKSVADTFPKNGKSEIFLLKFEHSFNYPPKFSISGYSNRIEDFKDTMLVTLVIDSIPANETNQIIKYSVEPTSNDLVNYSLDETGHLIITSKENKFGSQTFYITADDGTLENYKVTNSFTFEIASVNDAPVITGLTKELSTNEDVPLELKVTDLTIDDPDNVFPDDFTLTVYGGENYSFVNTT